VQEGGLCRISAAASNVEWGRKKKLPKRGASQTMATISQTHEKQAMLMPKTKVTVSLAQYAEAREKEGNAVRLTKAPKTLKEIRKRDSVTDLLGAWGGEAWMSLDLGIGPMPSCEGIRPGKSLKEFQMQGTKARAGE